MARKRPSYIVVFGGGFLVCCVVLAIVGPILFPGGLGRQSDSDNEVQSSGPIICEVFTPHAEIQRDFLHISLATDLPDDTVVMVGVSRNHVARTEDGIDTYSTNYLSEKSTVRKWKEEQFVYVNNGTFQKKFDAEMAQLRNIGILHEVIYVSDDIEVSFVIPVNQPDPRFGTGNTNLHSSLIKEDGSMRVIRAEMKIPRPLAAK